MISSGISALPSMHVKGTSVPRSQVCFDATENPNLANPAASRRSDVTIVSRNARSAGLVALLINVITILLH